MAWYKTLAFITFTSAIVAVLRDSYDQQCARHADAEKERRFAIAESRYYLRLAEGAVRVHCGDGVRNQTQPTETCKMDQVSEWMDVLSQEACGYARSFLMREQIYSEGRRSDPSPSFPCGMSVVEFLVFEATPLIAPVLSLYIILVLTNWRNRNNGPAFHQYWKEIVEIAVDVGTALAFIVTFVSNRVADVRWGKWDTRRGVVRTTLEVLDRDLLELIATYDQPYDTRPKRYARPPARQTECCLS